MSRHSLCGTVNLELTLLLKTLLVADTLSVEIAEFLSFNAINA